MDLYSCDLAQLIEETLVGCWWGRTAGKTSGSETVPIGELYAPQGPALALSDKKSTIEPIIDIEPHPVRLFRVIMQYS